MLRLFLLIAALALPAFAQAQAPTAPQTRAEALRRAREDKQRHARPNAPDGFQRAMGFVEGRGLFLVARDGIHPKLGSLTTGSGFAVGVGFRDRDLFRRRGMLEMWTAASAKKYWAAELRATFPELAGGRLRADAVATIREYPREDFFGLGPQSQRANHSTFSLRSEEVAARLGLRIAPVLTVGGGLGLLNPQTSGGKNASCQASNSCLRRWPRQVFAPTPNLFARQALSISITGSRATRDVAAGIAPN